MAGQIATNRSVERMELLAFVAHRHHAVLVTTRRNGGPQMSPVTLGVDDEDRLVVSTYPERAKAHNIRREPAVSVCVLSDDFGGEWVQIDGTAEVLDLPEALEPLVEYYRNIAGEHADWDEYRELRASSTTSPSPTVRSGKSCGHWRDCSTFLWSNSPKWSCSRRTPQSRASTPTT